MPRTKACDSHSVFDAYVGKYKPGKMQRMKSECTHDPAGCEAISEGEHMMRCSPKGERRPDRYHDQPIRDAFQEVWGGTSFDEFSELVEALNLTPEEKASLIEKEGEDLFVSQHAIYVQKVWNAVLAPTIQARYQDNYVAALPFRADVIRRTNMRASQLAEEAANAPVDLGDVETPNGFSRHVAFLSVLDAVKRI